MSALLAIDEAAAHLRCSRRRVFELLADGTLTRGPKYGKRTVVTAESVEAALQPTVTEPQAPQRRTRSSKSFKAELDAMLERRRSARRGEAPTDSQVSSAPKRKRRTGGSSTDLKL